MLRHFPLKVSKPKTGMTLGLVRILSYPTADRKVLWAMVSLEGTYRMALPYLYDLKTSIATPISNVDVDLPVYAARFSPDEQWLYVVYADRIVRYSADLSQRQQLLAIPFEVMWATLSLTTEYVFLAGGGEGALGDWLYRLPLY
jgi:hypothetical protein